MDGPEYHFRRRPRDSEIYKEHVWAIIDDMYSEKEYITDNTLMEINCQLCLRYKYMISEEIIKGLVRWYFNKHGKSVKFFFQKKKWPSDCFID